MSKKRKKTGGNPSAKAHEPAPSTVTPFGLAIPGSSPAHAIEIPTSAAPELADLASIFTDLVTASMAAHHVNEPAVAGPEHMFLRRACWEAAIISYYRCFNTGQGAGGQKRSTLRPFVDDLEPALRKVHDQVVSLRNTRIGHHVASASGQQVQLSIDAAYDSPGVIAVNDVHVSVESELYDAPFLAQLEDLTVELRDKVGTRIDALRFELQAQAAADPAGLAEALTNNASWSPPPAAPPSAGTS